MQREVEQLRGAKTVLQARASNAYPLSQRSRRIGAPSCLFLTVVCCSKPGLQQERKSVLPNPQPNPVCCA